MSTEPRPLTAEELDWLRTRFRRHDVPSETGHPQTQLRAHRAVCANDDEPWPCAHIERLDSALAASPAPRDERLEALRAALRTWAVWEPTVTVDEAPRVAAIGVRNTIVSSLLVLLGDAAALPVGDQELRDVEANPPDAVWSVTDRQYGWTAAFQAIRRAALRGAAPSPVPPDLAERFADLFMDLRLDGPAQDDWTYQQTARHYGAIFASWSGGAAVSQSDSLDVERKP